MNARLTFIHAFTSLHAGVGQGAGIIDLPVAREKSTGIPYLPGSSLKGALRTRCKTRGMEQECYEIFGPENVEDTNANASMIQFTDQRLLLLPVRSLAGTFAWVTSPYILDRFARDRRFAQNKNDWEVDLPEITDELMCLIAQEKEGSKIVVRNGRSEYIVYLEDLNLVPHYNKHATTLAQKIAKQVFPDPDSEEWRRRLEERFCIVSDDVLSFLLETATEITARIHLQEESKTVEDGGLWYEEALPAETILLGLGLAVPTINEKTRSPKRQPEEIFKFIQGLVQEPLQLGGRATVGRGLCQVRMEKEL